MGGSIKWVILFVLAFAFASMIVGFIKGAIQQRRINRKAAKEAPPKPEEAVPTEKDHKNKPKKKTAKQPEVRKPRRLGNSPEEPEEKR
ncbi:MAG: hypothetical protein IJ109_06580 [Firmicutes bacterium]|nr:hypothetical protein [Bacillota bacterium]MBQ9060302.1 hypothetical protein [Bacillota bacterium]